MRRDSPSTSHRCSVGLPDRVRLSSSAGASGVQAQASKNEEARCEGTRKVNVNLPARFTTNDLPGCPQGGLLLGTDKPDLLAGEKGDDEVRGLGGSDDLDGGPGNDILYAGDGKDGVLSGGKGDDVIHAGDGNEDFLSGDKGEDVIYGGDGNDILDGQGGEDGQRDKLYCGKGKDHYIANKNDYVDSSCEVKVPAGGSA